MNKTYFIIVSIIVIIYIIKNVKDNKLPVVESFLWSICAFLMLYLSIFPQTIGYFARMLKIDYPPSLLFIVSIIFLIINNFRMSKKMAKQEEKIISLAQEIAILKKK